MNIPSLQELMAQRMNDQEDCKAQMNPLEPVFSLLHGKWKTRVLFEVIALEIARFGQLKRAIPKITNTMLTSTLRELEKDGVIIRTQYNEIPLRVEYAITEKGKDLLPVYYEMYKWVMKYPIEKEGE
ncbi:helix-turn-helix domain-containing protein [Rossellomorea marisflavi]|uniref:winged helix-turn-helix transcriptional regulator n=1 Tax=Rossellomorea marisflavi TaxID=189381 RepID=UPI0028535EFC|nr:helix-turn-helix domain-containing protein [Rossellomorea marisflavi]MDR4935570.1 helix-turn-helix domain-containing protein [Rossellomorea marisflavi]